ncbi:MAG: suppressor of fused domain protein [Propionibacteriaceae bacterium]|nr:suppressor of fused domain protein [Propionibacteriaceae bacterium]
MRKQPSENDKAIFEHIRHLGDRSSSKVTQFLDDSEEYSIDLLSVVDKPDVGATTWATIGLSAYSIDEELPGDRELRVEFVGACGSEWNEVYSSAFGSCSFNIIKCDYGCHPGTVYPDVVRQYNDTLTMKHMMFVPVFLFDDIPNMQIGDCEVTWLQAIPISDAELEIRKERGEDKLTDLFERAQIDVYDLNRPSVHL